jgi:methylenetetrahydrofolate dehydrogenase (NADP+) / methenyltetrahydrofolate cyclohydrolase
MIIDGKTIAAEREQELGAKVAQFKSQTGITPGLAVVLAGNDPASELYVSMKLRRATEIGIRSELVKMSPDCLDGDMREKIEALNNDPGIHGIIIQLPFPPGTPCEVDQREILDSIDPRKDVDCLGSINFGLLAAGDPRYYPATVKGVLVLLDGIFSLGLWNRRSSYRDRKDVLAGKEAVVIGRSEIIGKPLAVTLVNLGATVTVCNAKTPNLAAKTRTADILVPAAGVPDLVTADMVKPGVVVIDVGISRIDTNPGLKTNYKVVGDVNFAQVAPKAAAITPVPGGVGPMTIISLLENTLEAASILSKNA